MDTERTLVPAIREALAAACPSLADGAASDAVAGIVPLFVASPSSTSEAASLMRAAASAGLAVVPRGAGTGLSWGAPPVRCDLVVGLARWTRSSTASAGDLSVARVPAGATIGQLATVLASPASQLAVDAPEDATVGGVVATGTAGPRRFRYGAPRDLLIGLTVVRADGVIAHSGGKVVKNVAGYDLGKLFSGSQGHAGADHRGDLPAASAADRGGVGDRGVRACGPGGRGRGGCRGGGVGAGPLGRGAGLARRVAAGAAGRGAARGHVVRGRRTGQAICRVSALISNEIVSGDEIFKSSFTAYPSALYNFFVLNLILALEY